MGYDERGHCPMLVDGDCSIYEHRPRTCRTYDCRVFAGHRRRRPDQPAIAERVRRLAVRRRRPEAAAGTRLRAAVPRRRAADRPGAARRSGRRCQPALTKPYGIDVTAVFARNSSRPLRTRALWLCSRCCHQCVHEQLGDQHGHGGVGPPALELVDEAQGGGGEVARRRPHDLERRVDALLEPPLLDPLGGLRRRPRRSPPPGGRARSTARRRPRRARPASTSWARTTTPWRRRGGVQSGGTRRPSADRVVVAA